MEIADESLERALADLEMLQAAYPDEVVSPSGEDVAFPLHFVLHLSEDSYVEFALQSGYPSSTPLSIVSYRSQQKQRIDAVVRAVRTSSQACLEDQVEAGFICCAAALEAWNESVEDETEKEGNVVEPTVETAPSQSKAAEMEWITGEPLMDRKSTFQAHVCRVSTESEVKEALRQLMDGNSKLQRATHNMYAYRLTEILPESGVSIKKFDNDDDGEDGAGSRLAHLLEMRQEDGVVVVVSRWFGGIKLGPKRFSHINNTARELLAQCHERHWNE